MLPWFAQGDCQTRGYVGIFGILRPSIFQIVQHFLQNTCMMYPPHHTCRFDATPHATTTRARAGRRRMCFETAKAPRVSCPQKHALQLAQNTSWGTLQTALNRGQKRSQLSDAPTKLRIRALTQMVSENVPRIPPSPNGYWFGVSCARHPSNQPMSEQLAGPSTHMTHTSESTKKIGSFVLWG